ncbi:MAG: hypothetical protein EWV76_23065, partial [Microcystis novacekii Mn_MB_F_20050700_S1]
MLPCQDKYSGIRSRSYQTIYGFVIPPLYGYLAFPLTIFGSTPEFQVLTNGLFSFLSIPLLIYFVYQLLE